MCLGTRHPLLNVLAFLFPWPGGLANIILSRSVNFFADPYAVDEVLVSPATRLPLALVLLLPLDITTSHLLPFAGYTARIDPSFAVDSPSVPTGKTPLTHFTSAFLRRTRSVMRAYGLDAMQLHDITAVWAAIAHPPGLEGPAAGWTFRRRLFSIERCAPHHTSSYYTRRAKGSGYTGSASTQVACA